ncbi:MAG: hypothetical protein A2429_03130 [Candidatus Veblenbacteria bacterium RIFOXYC1_FULL_42_9]|uniref:DUF3943 domain-containing protein n=1 Tax=Candidatus Veblenbacteria bacterium RIFOXYC1_FULL_42_9 TaxID=1802427 RepID=A0A1G2Q3M8_9BACT|nr:MAG: hypothetical protein A2429_03130 [Candidatus Veblenbacteria bacterium RIFOXYC1_FULL_42_9]
MRYLLVLIVCLAFPALSQTTSDSIPMDHRLVISAMLRTYSLHQGGKVNFSVSEKSEFLRSWSFYLNDYLPDINLSDNRLSHLATQTKNVLTIGFMDASLKGGWAERYNHYENFWRSGLMGGHGYGEIITGLLVASSLEYGLRNGDNNLWKCGLLFLSQATLASVLEHAGYWIFVNSSIPIQAPNGEYYGWRNEPRWRYGLGNNDANWMINTPAGWVNGIIYDDPPPKVRKESVFLSLPILYACSYLLLLPGDLKAPKENKIINFEPIIYFDGVDDRRGPGLYFGSIKMGLSWRQEFSGVKSELSFYTSERFTPCLSLSLITSSLMLQTRLEGVNQGKNFSLSGMNIMFIDKNNFWGIGYEKPFTYLMFGISLL